MTAVPKRDNTSKGVAGQVGAAEGGADSNLFITGLDPADGKANAANPRNSIDDHNSALM
eukprot:CAMPEP_0185574054 /NCGR_PEP_ID=MMETSP0434-20130131/5614_1 /TAXON_ID=626734 ORGANISM="Favella taraikaensis, Strain Fe Narragansett Bay" /NCGR_SAMPLE_ID=MMETSP0434 /ASSEMBLY_ACC=CAM_ASM_000379 /LENGTH=58 /DNA_ID=CAMNT_0028190493 /DNA_START=529 /DNA_END=705 /DNA_ORIENTATION=+